MEVTPLMERENGSTWNMKWKLGYIGTWFLLAFVMFLGAGLAYATQKGAT